MAAASGGAIRWFHNGTEIAGATGTTLALTNVLPALAGVYMAAVTGPAGTAYSQPAVIGVAPAPGARRPARPCGRGTMAHTGPHGSS